MNYADTLDYIYRKLPMYSRMGSAAYKKDLVNVRILCEHLGNPQDNFKSIHIAGTNGKGSVSHMLAAICQTAGLRTGLYTSPHLYDFRERIKLNGNMISEDFVTHFIQDIKDLIEEIEPSFFEITVAMAFQYFAEAAVEVAVVEVGLGGRLDSTNLILPELSVITNIGWDHMNMLGNTLPDIAREKAGIIKKNTPVVIGETLPETRTVFRDAAQSVSAPLFWAEEEWSVVQYSLEPATLSVNWIRRDGKILITQTDLAGFYQLNNLRTVLTAVDVLKNRGWDVTDENLVNALQSVKKDTGLGGRWEVLQQSPTVILEVAHNEDGVRKMLAHLSQLSYQHLHIVIGMVKDKEVESVVKLLPADAAYYFTQAAIPRALPAADLQQLAATHDRLGQSYGNVNEALKTAKENAGPADIVIVCGSIFLVAEVDRVSS